MLKRFYNNSTYDLIYYGNIDILIKSLNKRKSNLIFQIMNVI